jgi:hypothetical protein
MMTVSGSTMELHCLWMSINSDFLIYHFINKYFKVKDVYMYAVYTAAHTQTVSSLIIRVKNEKISYPT